MQLSSREACPPGWGVDGKVIGKPPGWALEQLEKQQVHVPSDEILPTWDVSGAVEEAQFLFRLGVHAAEMPSAFRWIGDSEFARAAEGWSTRKSQTKRGPQFRRGTP